jgi:hypothetical protein
MRRPVWSDPLKSGNGQFLAGGRECGLISQVEKCWAARDLKLKKSRYISGIKSKDKAPGTLHVDQRKEPLAAAQKFTINFQTISNSFIFKPTRPQARPLPVG